MKRRRLELLTQYKPESRTFYIYTYDTLQTPETTSFKKGRRSNPNRKEHFSIIGN
jgi:hypothetical protein